MALTKQDIVEAICAQIGISRADAVFTVESILNTIKATLASGDDILVSGFGKFQVRKKHERRGRNPATGETIQLAPRRVVTFKVAGQFRDLVNNGSGNKKPDKWETG